MIPRYETDAQGMKDSTRYEKCAQGIQEIHKGMKCVFRYETGVFLKNSWFSYLYGSISYLFGYEKNRCFFLMIQCEGLHTYAHAQHRHELCVHTIQHLCKLIREALTDVREPRFH